MYHHCHNRTKILNHHDSPELLKILLSDVHTHTHTTTFGSLTITTHMDNKHTVPATAMGQVLLGCQKKNSRTNHQNIRNFIKTRLNGVKFDFGITLTRKNTGENEWDLYAKSWIP